MFFEMLDSDDIEALAAMAGSAPAMKSPPTTNQSAAESTERQEQHHYPSMCSPVFDVDALCE